MQLDRIAGLAGIFFVAIVVAINALDISTGQPDPGSSAEAISDWIRNAGYAAHTISFIVPLAWVLLGLFAAGILSRAIASKQHGALVWSIVGSLGVAMTMGTLSAAIAAHTVLATRIDTLPSEWVGLLSDFMMVLFVMNWAALALAMLGLSQAARLCELGPRWVGVLGIVGACLLMIGATQSHLALLGILPGLLVGLLGFLMWLALVAMLGAFLLSKPRLSAPA